MTLYTQLQLKIQEWRNDNYKCSEYPEITEILNYNKSESGDLRYLRAPQFEAIETYLYIRFVLKTPHTIDLFKKLFENNNIALFDSLGIKHINKDANDDVNIDSILNKIKNDTDGIVKKYKYQTLNEALNLDYSSYILALAMGVGKTILIGSIIAIEFSIALEHLNDDLVMKNALIFAQGTTILSALKEIMAIPFEKILPARLYKQLMPNLKINYIKDGDKDFSGVIENSKFNILITNTEKIIVRNKTYKNDLFHQKKAEDELYENQRLAKIKSLKNLGIFSDEAHHTYGNNLNDLKRIRETINRININNKIICIVNTTGTPYFEKEPLKEVIYWYSLESGIRDNILKSLENNIAVYDFDTNNEESIIEEIIKDFFTNYKNIKLSNGCISKIAFYFKTQEHLDISKLFIEKALLKINESPTIILTNTQQSTAKEIEEFNSLNSAESLKRIILLISKGTEGWNCPSLFATALVKDNTNSNNFILQASTRCLRQLPDNQEKAKIYLSNNNKEILNKELEQTYNITISNLSDTKQETIETNNRVLKEEYPQLQITKIINKIVRDNDKIININFSKIDNSQLKNNTICKTSYNIGQNGLTESNTTEQIQIENNEISLYTASIKIAKNYHLNTLEIYNELNKIYKGFIPEDHLIELFKQVESQTQNYKNIKEYITTALAIIKFKDEDGNYIFQKDSNGCFYHTIRYTKNSLRHKLLTEHKNEKLGFHFNIYDFDSNPEKSFFIKILNILEINNKDIKDLYFLGSLQDTKKTDFHFEYESIDKKYHNYFPDFLIVKNNGEFLIVEIKSSNKKDDEDVKLKAKSVKCLENINENKFKYIIIYADNDEISNNNQDYLRVCNWLNKKI